MKGPPMIGFELSVRTQEGHRVELVQTLEDLSAEQLASASCVECHVYEDLKRPDEFLWLQWWQSEQELQRHLSSADFRTLLGAIKVLGSLVSARIVGLQDSTSLMGAFLTDRSEPGSIQT